MAKDFQSVFDTVNNTDLLELVEKMGYELKKSGNSYFVKIDEEVSSLNIFYSNKFNAWRWKRFSHTGETTYGGAVTLVAHLMNKSTKEAFKYLTDNTYINTATRTSHKPKDVPVAVFNLPQKNAEWINNKPPFARLFGYLCSQRKIDKDIVKDLIAKDMLYLSKETIKSFDKPIYNCIFVGQDKEAKPRWAASKGTNTKFKWAATLTGSNTNYTFFLKNSNSNRIKVFESPIDALSYLTLQKHKGTPCHDNIVALGGLFDQGLAQRLKDNPQIKNIDLLLDNDVDGTTQEYIEGKKITVPQNHGQKYTKELMEKYGKEGYCCFKELPPTGKDWNEYLQTVKETPQEYTQTGDCEEER